VNRGGGRTAASTELLAGRAGASPDAEAARLAFLAETTDSLASPFDEASTLDQIARLAVPRLADWCAVHLVDDGTSSLVRRVSRHSDPSLQDKIDALLSPYVIDPTSATPVGDALRSRKPQLITDVTDEMRAGVTDPVQKEISEQLGWESVLVVPFVIRGRTLGVINLVLGASGRHYGEADVSFCNSFGRRCALALDNARLFREAQELVERSDQALALLDTLVTQAPIGLGFVDTDLRYVQVNDFLAETNGVAPSAHLGLTVAEVIPYLADLVVPHLQAVLETGLPTVDLEIAGPPDDVGEQRHFLASYYPVIGATNETHGVGIVVQDITQRSRADLELQARARQQEAVASLGQRALMTHGVEEVLGDAAHTAAVGLDLEYSTILELAGAGPVLRARAVHGWENAQLGQDFPLGPNSQAGYTLEHGGPTLVEDLSTETRFAVHPSTVEVGVLSAISVLIGSQDEPFGVITCHCTNRRRFADHDIDFLDAVANVVAAALDRALTEAELDDERQRLRLALDAGHMGTWEWDIASGRLSWSSTLERIYGFEEGTFPGTYEAYRALLSPEDVEAASASIQQALETGSDHRTEHSIAWPDGSVHWVQGAGRVIRDSAGEPLGMIGISADITAERTASDERQRLLEAEQAARAEAEAARDQLEFLSEASAILGSSLNYQHTLTRVAQLVVPRLADWCAVEVVEGDTPTQVSVAHADPAKVELARRLREEYPTVVDDENPQGAAKVLRTGQPDILYDIRPEQIDAAAVDDEHLELLRSLQLTSSMVVPLIARGRILGTLTFVGAESGKRYTDDDLPLAMDLARRAAVAIDNARLYRERSDVALTLQQSLLPPALPDIPGIEIVARYRPLTEGAEIGGDFYDLFETPEGAWAIVIGDACGKGTQVASLTGLARHTLRAAVFRESEPSRVLSLVNDAMIGQIPDNRFCTITYVRLEPTDTGATLRVGCGGHPAPIILRANGDVEVVRATGTLVGLIADPEFTDASVDLGVGDYVVLYTDGVIEARDATGLVFGDERLIELIGSCSGMYPDGLADVIQAAAVDFQQGRLRDDLAVLVLRVKPRP
jgi:PAS domain S-box-containing protein